ncbi:hypothetical protein TNCV_2471011 [Trichonephila clavipes]|nr:hypothetical protein TNCV_2471011 [Trichonephila clavipes]
MCSRRHGGGRARSTTPAEDRYIVLSAKRNMRTTAQQVANQFLAASGKQISRKTVARRLRGGGIYAMVPKYPGKGPISDMQYHGVGRHHDQWPHVPTCVANFRGAVGDKFVFMDDNATCHQTLAVQDCLDSEGIQRLVWPS